MAAKVLLVEDDNNLREIYEARLMAEGYTIVTASDGEEALVVAKAEKPDLVISDVMMPRVSGFEMLDILRNTDGLKNVKVIMLTALGQADDRTRANSLGADRYLVKSQVTLEDIVKAAHELLEGGIPQPAPAAAMTDSPVPPAPTPAVIPVSQPPVSPAPAPAPAPVQPAPAPQPAAPEPPVMPMAPPAPSRAFNPIVGAPAPQPPVAAMPSAASGLAPGMPANAPTTSQEQATVDAQINNFVQQPVPATAQDDAVLAGAMRDLAASSAPPAGNNPPSPTPPSPAPVPGPQVPGTSDAPAGSKKVIQPLNKPAPTPAIHELLAKDAGNSPVAGAPGTVVSPAGSMMSPTPQPPVPPIPAAPVAPAPQQSQPAGIDPNSISL